MIQRLTGKLKRLILRYALTGSNVFCNCCNHSFIIFLPFGGASIKRQNALCPNCLSLERHRLLLHYLSNETNLFTKSLSVLHLAPERTLHGILSHKQELTYTPGDLFPEKYPKGTLKVDATDIPFDENYFDVVLCNHVLEHIPEDQKAINEIFRVLKPGGWAVLQVPMDKSLEQSYEDPTITTPAARKQAFGQIDHVRLYGLDYYKRLEQAGFKVHVEDYSEKFSDQDIFKYGFRSSDDIILGIKPN